MGGWAGRGIPPRAQIPGLALELGLPESWEGNSIAYILYYYFLAVKSELSNEGLST